MAAQRPVDRAPIVEPALGTGDLALVTRILGGDAEALGAVVDRLYRPMAAVAGAILRDPALVDDVVQDAWVRVLDGLVKFEGRASLRTWVLTIVANCARTRAGKRARGLEVAWEDDPAEGGPVADPALFNAIGRWREGPGRWREGDSEAEAALLLKERRAVLERELERLPPTQRALVTLRDLEEVDAASACELLGLSDANQRVLLHRARLRLRAALAKELEGR